MATAEKTPQQLLLEIEELALRLQEAEETLEAIRSGAVDALVVATPQGEEQLFTLEGADRVYRVFLESIAEGAVTLNHEGMILYANAAASQLLAAGGGGVAGTSLRASVSRDERRRFDALFEAGRRGPHSAEIRLRGRRGGRPINLSLRPLADRSDVMVSAVLTDLAEHRKNEKVLEAERLARSILEQTGESILVCDLDGVIIRASRSVASLIGRDPLFQAFQAVLPLRTTDGDRPYPSRFAGPTPTRGLEVRFERPDGVSFRLVLNADPLRTAAGRIGTVVTLTDVTRLREAEEARERLLADLEQTNRELGAVEALSLAGLTLTTMGQLAHSIVSTVAAVMNADVAALWLVRGERLELAASVPPLQPHLKSSIGVGTGFVGTVAKLRRSLVVSDVRSSRLVKRRELIRRVRSLLGVPLLAEAKALGVLHVGWRDGHEPDITQQRFLEIVAARASAAISAQLLTDELDEQRLAAQSAASESARLYEEQRRIATTLQKSLVHPPPKVKGLDLGVVSQPASEPELVGGDFSDVFVVDDSHVVVLIGDVAGKGVQAAGLTETVRSTVRTLAVIDPSLAFILGQANDLLRRYGTDKHVTAFCAVIDPNTGHVSFASAGHPAPVHLSAFDCRYLEASFGPPLGTWEHTYASAHALLAQEDCLVFYTDGVSEARRGGEFFDEGRLLETVAGLRGLSAQRVAQAVRDEAVAFAGALRDDLEVVALRLAWSGR
jgi:PAS domain S-box-containing protein